MGAYAAPQTYTAYQATGGGTPTTPWATAGLICGLCALISPFPCGILGIIFGYIALGEIKQSGDRVGGRGLAIAGITIGAIALALLIAGIVLYFVFIYVLFQSIAPSSGWAPLFWA